jgi:CheY-like chemotaxis protein
MTEQVILQVEDDDSSYFVFNELFKEICPDIRLERARDGTEALKKIERLVQDPAMDLRLILLDVFLPRADGWEVLDSIRADDRLKQLPVAMFTNVLSKRDQARCEELGVKYLEKPADLDGLVLLVKEICARVSGAVAEQI